jgi:PAS domain-containing protein
VTGVNKGAGSGGLKSSELFHLSVVGLMLVSCGLFYYAGEIVDFFGWDGMRWGMFYVVHDVHRLLFLAPVLYVAHVFGVRASIITAIVAAGIVMPRALFISPYPDPLLRMVLSMTIVGTMGYLTARNRRESRQRRYLEGLLRNERDTLSGILDRMPNGVLIVGPDYRVRFANPVMRREFGVSVGSRCYRSMYEFDTPCPDMCRLRQVIRGSVESWQYIFPDGRSYEVVASPYVDRDGVVCQLATYRDLSAGLGI